MDVVFVNMLKIQVEFVRMSLWWGVTIVCVCVCAHVTTLWILVLVCNVASLVWAHSFGADEASNRSSWSSKLDSFSTRRLHQVHNICINLWMWMWNMKWQSAVIMKKSDDKYFETSEQRHFYIHIRLNTVSVGGLAEVIMSNCTVVYLFFYFSIYLYMFILFYMLSH